MPENPTVEGGHHSFAIRTWRQYFDELVLPVYEDYKKDPASSRHAILSAMTVYHFREWLWKQRFQDNAGEQREVFNSSFKGQREFIEHVGNECPHLRILGDICNGSKHFGSKPRNKSKAPKMADTKRQGGISTVGAAYASAFYLGAHVMPYLCVTLDDRSTVRFEEALDAMIEYWRKIRAK
ncbi:MAG: hypothetical protein ABFD60_09185 [Bryobacteraceae bacterium]